MKQVKLGLAFSVVCIAVSCERNAEDVTYSEREEPAVKADAAHPSAPAAEEEDMDAMRADRPVMAEAIYDEVKFPAGDSHLEAPAQAKLDSLAKEIKDGAEVYLTVRVKDEDTVEATPPDEELSAMANPRMQSIRQYLEEQGVNIVEVGIDTAREVGNYGEANALARPQEQSENTQLVVIDILLNP